MIELENREKAAGLFCNPTDSVVFTILEGKKGMIWADNAENPTMVMAFDGIYAYLDGDLTVQFTEQAVEKAWRLRKTESVIFIPQNEKAEQCLENIAVRKGMENRVRYKMKEPKQGFSVELLKQYIRQLPLEMQMTPFNKAYFQQINTDEKLEYLTESYQNYKEFQTYGAGFLIVEDTKIAAGAVAYSSYREGIEIQIMTAPEYRGRGLATIAVARLLLECVNNGWRAIWDAANLTSVSVAKKVGYTMERTYQSFVMSDSKEKQ